MAGITNVFTDTISTTYSGNGKAVSSQVGTYTGTKDAGVAVVVTAGAVNQEIDIVFPHSTIQSIIIASDQDVTVKVNNSSPGDQTLSVKKTAAIVWGSDYVADNPLNEDVTKMFVSNPGVTDAKFNVRVLYN